MAGSIQQGIWAIKTAGQGPAGNIRIHISQALDIWPEGFGHCPSLYTVDAPYTGLQTRLGFNLLFKGFFLHANVQDGRREGGQVKEITVQNNNTCIQGCSRLLSTYSPKH